MSVIKVLIADDHVMVREGLCQLLGTQPDIKVVGEASDGMEALEKAKTLRPDVLLLDIAMPVLSGLEAASLICQTVPETRVIILSMYEKEAYVHRALSAGALGYLLKGEPSDALLEAIRVVFKGRYFLSPKMTSGIIDVYLKNRKKELGASRYELLTEREKQVFLLLAEGNSSATVSDILCISPKTIEKHRANICKKIGLSNPIDMMKYAVRIGVIDPEFWKS